MPQPGPALLSLLLALGAAAPAAAGGGVKAPDPLVDEAAVDEVKAAYTKREADIPMRDGVKLHTVVYEPIDRSRRYPILLQRTPYGSGPYGEGFKEALGPSPHFQKEGFIFVYQDVRGRFMSEGTFVNMTPSYDVHTDPAKVDEASDAWDTVAWLLEHVENHNGKVGQWGISYPGFYTAAAMVDAHPAVAAVSPQAPITDWFEGDDFHRRGALWLPHAFNFFADFGRPRPKPVAESPKTFRHGTPDGYAFFLRLGALRHADERYLHHEVGIWNDLMAHPTYDAYWKARNLRPHLGHVRPAVLTVGGWFDAENLFGALQVYKAVEATPSAGHNWLVMGPWSHGQWARGLGERLGDAAFGSNTSLSYQETVEFPFFMHWLKGAPDPGLPEATVFDTGLDAWKQLPAWPPKEARSRALYLQPGGKLAFAPPPANGGADSFVSDPAKPVPYTSKVAVGMTKEYMTEDQRFAERRPDVLTYASEPLEADLTVAGPLKAELWVSTTGTDADWVVKLIDVFPDDAPDLPEVPDLKRGGYEMLVRGEAVRGKFRSSLEAPQPFVPFQPTRVAWPLNDVLHTFRKGHRLMIQVQSTWFPLMDRNPQKFMDINQAQDSDFQKATHKVFHSAPLPSRVVVGVVE